MSSPSYNGRPIEIDLETRAGRFRAHWRAFLSDHGFARKLIRGNFHRIDAEAYRSGQPSRRDLRRYAKKYGIRTVVNLRGWNLSLPALVLEVEACAELGLRLVHFRMRSRKLLPPDRLRSAKELLEDIEYPVLFHCKSGADRSGMMATLYLHWIRGVPVEEIRQLRLLPYFHCRHGKTGLLDYFFEQYLLYQRKTGGDLLSWLDTAYDPDRLKAEFLSRPLADLIIDRVLRRE